MESIFLNMNIDEVICLIKLNENKSKHWSTFYESKF